MDGRSLDGVNLREEEEDRFLSSPSGDDLNLRGEGLGQERSGLSSPLKLGFSLLDRLRDLLCLLE